MSPHIRTEADFLKALKVVARQQFPDCVWGRHVDRFSTGVADVELVWRGMTTWLELKLLTGWPTRNRPLIGPGLLTPLQAKFLGQRHAAGIRAYALLGIKESQALIGCYAVPANSFNLWTSAIKQHLIYRITPDRWLAGLIGPPDLLVKRPT